MDPKVFFETGQTTGKNVSGNATDTSGETAKQAGRAFKEAFNAANAAGNVDPEVINISKREVELYPFPPPGMNKVVSE